MKHVWFGPETKMKQDSSLTSRLKHELFWEEALMGEEGEENARNISNGN